MNVLDLFSGIGGFSLGLERAGMKNIAFCEKDKFCQKVLRKHWPAIPIFEDITKLKGEMIDETIDLVCGGFPCQPFSVAGKRKGKEDVRHLWPEMFRIIQETKPTWVIGENVAGIINLELEQVCTDLESEGYEVQAFIIPACAVNAPHRRDRVWIIAYSEGIGRKRWNSIKGEASGTDGKRIAVEFEGSNKAFNSLSNTTGKRCNNRTDNRQERYLLRDENRNAQEGESKREGRERGIREINTDVADSDDTKRQLLCRQKSKQENIGNRDYNRWDENWIEVAQRLCKFYDGVSSGLAGHLTKDETYGIIGFIYTIRRYHYATENEDRNKALSILQQADAEESVSKFFGKFRSFYEPEILQCIMHGKSYDEREKDEIGISENSNKTKKELLRKMREERKFAYASQGFGLEKQCSCKFDDLVRELSSEIALGEWEVNSQKAQSILFGLWKESRGERFLSEPLPSLYEIWRSITDKEIGSFRRHYYKRDEQRVDRLKCLGNSVVPQIVEIIGNYIMEVERTSKIQKELFV